MARWKPTTALADQLVECGVDRHILDDLLREATETATSLTTPALFVATAVSMQCAWTSSLDESQFDQDQSFQNIPPRTRMARKWRPSKATFTLLIAELGIVDKVDLHFIRAGFVRHYDGEVQRNWDCLFIDYALAYAKDAKEDQQADVKSTEKSQEKVAESALTAHELFENRGRLRSLVRSVLEGKHITPSLKRVIDDQWQPRPWVVQKLRGMKIPKWYIYSDDKLKPFRAYYKTRQKLFVNYDVAYFHWIRTRYFKEIDLLKQEKARLQAVMESA